MMAFLGWAIHQLSIPKAPAVHEQIEPPLSPNASLRDSVVGPPNAQAQPAPLAPPLVRPRQAWGIAVDVILGYAAFLAAAGGLFCWSLCITHILREAAQSWGDQDLSRWFLIFFIAAWCIFAVWGALVGKWGFYNWNMLPIGQQLWEKHLMTYKEFPPLQAPEICNLSGILDAMKKGGRPSD